MMWDVLTFDHFITPDVLRIAYYLGAVAMPLALWAMRAWLLRRIGLLADLDSQRQQLFASLSQRNRILVVASMILLFLFMELAWRVMFEAMIGYFQMHDYLQILAASQQGRLQ